MSKEIKESKEEAFNRKKLDSNYEATNYCPICHVKLSIDGSCGSMICGGR